MRMSPGDDFPAVTARVRESGVAGSSEDYLNVIGGNFAHQQLLLEAMTAPDTTSQLSCAV